MKIKVVLCLVGFFIFSGCGKIENSAIDDEISVFAKEMLLEHVEIGEAYFDSQIKSTFISERILSFFKQTRQHTGDLHSSVHYSGINYIKMKNGFKKLALTDLFPEKGQMEKIRHYCQENLKQNPLSYFYGPDAIRMHLDLLDLQDFYIESGMVVIFFQPYVVGGIMDEPFTIRFPYVVGASIDE